MKPNLLMRAWMMAHLFGTKYQAVVCNAGSSGEVAFHESLCPHYTSTRHDAKGLRTYYITGTCGDAIVSRIASGRIGSEVAGCDEDPLRITITSNACSWQGGDLSNNDHLVTIVLDMRLVEEVCNCFLYGCRGLEGVDLSSLVNLRAVGKDFLSRCSSLKSIDLTPLWAVEVLPDGFLDGCTSLEEIDLSPLVNLREVGTFFLCRCSGMKSIDLTPLRAIEVLPDGFLVECRGLVEVDLWPLANVREVGTFFLCECSGMTSIDLTPLSAVGVLPEGFLDGCSSLVEVDLSPLANLNDHSENYLRYCTSLKVIVLGPHQSGSGLPSEVRGRVVVRVLRTLPVEV